jgi:hypothetical protein
VDKEEFLRWAAGGKGFEDLDKELAGLHAATLQGLYLLISEAATTVCKAAEEANM